jgi:hypothetical protein
MTLEEAAEVVLQGNAWKDCPTCEGKGWAYKAVEVGDPVTLSPDGEATAFRHCRLCGGSGGSICEVYALACTLLSRELPQELLRRAMPWDEKVKRLQEQAAIAVRLPIGYVTGMGPDGLVKVQHSQEWGGQQTYQRGAAEYLYRPKTK